MIIGIDQSINCTGIVVNDDYDYKNYYYVIVPDNKLTKKQKLYEPVKNVYLETYKSNTSQNEYDKFVRISNLVDVIENILLKHNPDLVVLEGIAFGAVGRTSDLTGLQYLIRNICYNNDIPFVIIPATTVKKEFTGNGSADKDLMVKSFEKCTGFEKSWFPFKIDDIADAYALSHIPNYIIEWYGTH